ncbi:uncharacterized protein [Oscarella lobularis]|uniref:uncharacterized protein isoform X2 n=1 Tax=Oscarella lobularis TaxID=121494 RepID=UPI003313690B
MEKWLRLAFSGAIGIITFYALKRIYRKWLDQVEEDAVFALPNFSPRSRVRHPSRLSSSAFVQSDHEIVTYLSIVARDQAERHANVHRGVSCNSCRTTPISGVRYKCANCVDYDVCERCLDADRHAPTHVFLRIVVPVCPLANPRSALVRRPFYPGNVVATTSSPLDPEVLNRIRNSTHFDACEIVALYAQYSCLCTSAKGISRSTFDECLGPLGLERNLILDRLFDFYDRDSNEWIDFEEFCAGLSILTKAGFDERIEPAFRGYDLEHTGFANRQNLRRMFKAYFYVTVELVRDVVRGCEEEMMEAYEDDPSKPVSAIFNAPIAASSSSGRRGCGPSWKRCRKTPWKSWWRL